MRNLRAHVRSWFSKRTERLRYRIVFFIIKYITPKLHKNLEVQSQIVNSITYTPRPSTLFMKNYFDNKLLDGVEVGVSKGENSFSLMRILNIRKLYLVDIYESEIDKLNYAKAIKKMGVYGDRIQFIIKKSVDASKDIKELVDFVYIDADHSYNAVYEDLEFWYPLVKNGGVICGHDILNCIGVIDALKDWCIPKGIIFTIDFPDFYFVKEERA